MRITDEAVIKDGEKELIDSIIGDLDWTAIEDIFKEKHQLDIQDDVEYKQGDIVVHDNDVAYKLDFDVKVTLSILFDRSGNSVSIETSGDLTKEPNPTAENDTVAEAVEGTPLPEEPGEIDDEETIVDAGEEESSISDSPEDIQNINDNVPEPAYDAADEIDAVSEEEDMPPPADEVPDDIKDGTTEDIDQISEEVPIEAAGEEAAEPTDAAMEASPEAVDILDSQTDASENIQNIDEEITEPPDEVVEEVSAPAEEDDIPLPADEVVEDMTEGTQEDMEQIAAEDPLEAVDEAEAQPAEAIAEDSSEVPDIMEPSIEETGEDAVQTIEDAGESSAELTNIESDADSGENINLEETSGEDPIDIDTVIDDSVDPAAENPEMDIEDIPDLDANASEDPGEEVPKGNMEPAEENPDQTADDIAALDEENLPPLETETDDLQPEEAVEELAAPETGEEIEITDEAVDSPKEDPEDFALAIEESDEATAADPTKQPAENITDMTSEIAEMVTELDEETV